MAHYLITETAETGEVTDMVEVEATNADRAVRDYAAKMIDANDDEHVLHVYLLRDPQPRTYTVKPQLRRDDAIEQLP